MLAFSLLSKVLRYTQEFRFAEDEGNSSDDCPGAYAQCCPSPAIQRPPAMIEGNINVEDNTNLFVQQNLANPDVISGDEISLGNLNPDDRSVFPLENENLFLASDNTDDYGLIAGLGDLSTGEPWV